MHIEEINTIVATFIIHIAECMGIFVVAWSLCQPFVEYLLVTFFHKHYAFQSDLANGLATALEFKMAAEILKTVLVQDLSELAVLGVVIGLRALLSLLIYFELKHSEEHELRAVAEREAMREANHHNN